MARPTACTPDVIEQIEDLKAQGLPDSWCAEALGIHPSTIVDWKNRGASGDQPFKAFSEAYVRGRLKRKRHLLRIVTESAESGERGSSADARWLLEKECPEEYGRTPAEVHVHHSGQTADIDPQEAGKTLRAIRGGKGK